MTNHKDDNEKNTGRTINTGGGSYIEGTSQVEGGDFVGRDRSDKANTDTPGFPAV